MDFKKLATQYKDELMNHILPFWLECSQDHEYGGYFTCLDRQGNVFDTDKFIWLQGREVWMFSMLYNKVEKRQEWLDCAIQGVNCPIKYVPIQRENPAIDIAKPRTLVGYISERSTNTTAQIDTAQQNT